MTTPFKGFSGLNTTYVSTSHPSLTCFHFISFQTSFHAGACQICYINARTLSSFIVQAMRQKRKKQSTVKDGYESSADEDDDSYEKSETEIVAPVESFRRRRRVIKRRLKKNDCNLQNPLVVCGCDIMLMIFGFLDARSVASSLLVSRPWRRVACSDTIWSEKIKELWADKAHLPYFALVEGLSKLSTYTLSIKDGKRSRILKEDLWDHDWEFHFKEDAPEYWRNLDTYWRGTGPPMRCYFHPDGSLTADANDPVWGGHESYYTIVTGVLADGKIREHYVRINRWPQLSISRRQDWGWEMSNQYYFYSSIPDAYKKGGTGPYLPVH